jgi:branched-chain amino acid aminotransferase
MLDYRGYIAEATGANVFFLMEDGKLHTPLADCFLNGITRQTVIEMAAEKGVEVVERHMEPEELEKVKECFLTGTAAEVTPVSQIGEYHFKPDVLTREFVQGYADLVNGR